jgi:hypothetical protein
MLSHYQSDLLQLQIVIYTAVNMSYGKSNQPIAYPYESLQISACVHVMKQSSSEEWQITIGS